MTDKAYERQKWAELRETYRRCILIAEEAWQDRLDKAQAEQRSLSEQMRDRGEVVEVQPAKTTAARAQLRVKGDQTSPVEAFSPVLQTVPREIHVGLFTPRDRLQFIKESAVSLLISADRRNLTATPEPKDDASSIDRLEVARNTVTHEPEASPLDA